MVRDQSALELPYSNISVVASPCSGLFTFFIDVSNQFVYM